MNSVESSKETTKNHFNSTAEKYDSSLDGKFVKCMYDEILKQVLKLRPKKVLDLGCGNGNVLKLLEENIDADLYGLDLSNKMIIEAKKRLGDNVTLRIGDAEKLPYNDNEFDAVICNASFHHYPNPELVLKGVKRILKKDGLFILGDPTAPFDWYLKILNYCLKYSNSGDYKIYNEGEITDLLCSAGFKVKSFKRINYRTFILTATN